MKHISILLFLSMMLFLLPDQAFSAPTSNRVPTNIQSDAMEYDAAAQTVIFSGDVHVTRPDFELWSKTLTVYLKQPEDDGQGASSGMRAGDIDRMVAETNVRIQSDDNAGHCQKATYYADSDTVIMEGSPVLTSPDSVIKSEVITHHLGDNKSRADGRVNASFQAPDKTLEAGGSQ